MHLCPFCQSPVKSPPKENELSRKRKAVYDYIVSAGPDGVDVSDVMAKFYDGKSETTLRTAIYYINQSMHPIRIGRRSRRFIIHKLEG